MFAFKGKKIPQAQPTSVVELSLAEAQSVSGGLIALLVRPAVKLLPAV